MAPHVAIREGDTEFDLIGKPDLSGPQRRSDAAEIHPVGGGQDEHGLLAIGEDDHYFGNLLARNMLPGGNMHLKGNLLLAEIALQLLFTWHSAPPFFCDQSATRLARRTRASTVQMQKEMRQAPGDSRSRLGAFRQ
jgi:hypothetical protein